MGAVEGVGCARVGVEGAVRDEALLVMVLTCILVGKLSVVTERERAGIVEVEVGIGREKASRVELRR